MVDEGRIRGPSNQNSRPNTWFHAGFTLSCLTSGCQVNHYVNGSFVYNYNLTTSVKSGNNGSCRIGRTNAENGRPYFTGYMSDLLIWDYTLTAAQMLIASTF